MKKRLQKCAAFISACIMLSVNASAAEHFSVTEDFAKNQLTVSGAGIDGEQILFQILQKGKNFSDWTKGSDPNAFILWQGQQTSDGSISFTIPYSEELKAGTYQARMISDMRDDMGGEALSLVGTKTYSDAVLAMKKAAVDQDYTTFQSCIDGGDQDVSPVGFDLTVYKKLIQGSTPEKLFAGYIKHVAADANFGTDKVFDETAQKERSEAFHTYMLMEAFKQKGTITDLKSELSKTELVTKEQTLWSNLGSCLKTDGEWTYFLGKMESAAGSLSDSASLKTALIHALILTETRYADGNDIQNVLSTLGYGSTIGIASPTTNSKVYTAMSGKDYANIDAFKNAYNSYLSQYSAKDGGGSSSGGGSKHSSGSGDVYYPGKLDRTDQTSETKKPIKVEFVDIEGIAWAQEAIIALADQGILSGKENGYFDPDGNVTREEFAKILVCAAGYENESFLENHFSDIPEDAWYCKFVNIAYEKGLVHGIGNGSFGVGMQISRQDMAVMICNALKQKGTELPAGELTFHDQSEIAEYAQTAVAALVAMGAVSGVSKTEFQPLGNATRAQAAKIIYGVLEKLQ